MVSLVEQKYLFKQLYQHLSGLGTMCFVIVYQHQININRHLLVRYHRVRRGKHTFGWAYLMSSQ